MPLPEALIILAPIIKQAVTTYLSSEIPEQVNRRIQDKVQEIVQGKLNDLLVSLNHTKNIYTLLAAFSLGLTAVQLFLQNGVFSHLSYLVLYFIPLFMSVRSLRNMFLTLQSVLRLEGTIKAEITRSLEEAHLSKRVLFKFFEKRSIEDLAKFTAGTIVFELTKKISENRNVIIKSIISYFISFLNIFLLRYLV